MPPGRGLPYKPALVCSHRLAVRTRPSQGRNPGSIPGGSTIGLATLLPEGQVAKSISDLLGGGAVTLQPGTFYRAQIEGDESDEQFVYFVGWGATNSRLIFETGAGALHRFYQDEVDFYQDEDESEIAGRPIL